MGKLILDSSKARYDAMTCQQAESGCGALSLLASTLFPLFSVLDYFCYPQHYADLSVIRFSTTLIYAIFYFAIRRGHFLRKPVGTALFLLILAAVSITSMCVVVGGYATPYYAGINLVMLASILLFPWGARRMAVAVSTILAIYFVGVLLSVGFRVERFDLFLNNAFFLLSTGVIGVTAAGIADRLRRQGFDRLLEVERAREELKRADEIKTRFFANVSHELKTPLTLILGPASAALKSVDAPEIEREQLAENLSMIERNARTLFKHVTDLLEVARLDSREQTVSYANVDLAELLRGAASCFELHARERGIAFQIETPEACPVQVDPEKVERILINLLSNAFKFTPSHGSIRCALGIERDPVLIVEDSGPGIPLELRSRVFERFFQVEESNVRRFGGTGLGLSIVKELTELHGGQVELGESSRGGAAFRVRLPARAPVGVLVQPIRAGSTVPRPFEVPPFFHAPSELNAQEPVAVKAMPRVLVVEDNADMAAYIASVLSARFEVVRAVNGREGIKQALRIRPDLVVSDIMMPEASGIELLEALKKQEELADIPVILLTARSEESLRVELLRMGAEDFILKPFLAEELLLRASLWAGLKRSRDVMRKALTRGDRDIEVLANELSAKKEALQSAVISREEFIAIASHELKTPLTSLKLWTQLLQKRILSPESPDQIDLPLARRVISNYDEQIERICSLVDDMLDFSRIKAGRLQLNREEVELDSLIQRVLKPLGPTLAAQGIELETRLETGIAGQWDRARLEQVLTNLVGNAIKYGRGKPIEVRAMHFGDRARIEVIDQGSGISAENLARIFDRYERVAATSHVGGLGLGLYITQQIVNAHGGTIEARSELGKGSVFCVELPLAQAVPGLKVPDSELTESFRPSLSSE